MRTGHFSGLVVKNAWFYYEMEAQNADPKIYSCYDNEQNIIYCSLLSDLMWCDVK